MGLQDVRRLHRPTTSSRNSHCRTHRRTTTRSSHNNWTRRTICKNGRWPTLNSHQHHKWGSSSSRNCTRQFRNTIGLERFRQLCIRFSIPWEQGQSATWQDCWSPSSTTTTLKVICDMGVWTNNPNLNETMDNNSHMQSNLQYFSMRQQDHNTYNYYQDRAQPMSHSSKQSLSTTGPQQLSANYSR